MSLRAATGTLCSAEIDRVDVCVGSAVLSRASSEKPMYAQWWGILAHRYLEMLKTKGRNEALLYVYAKFRRGRRMCERIDESMLPEGEPEVGVVHRPARRQARRAKYPDFGDPNGELYGGKGDVVDLRARRPIVYDYKCGPGPKDPRTSQMLGLGAAFEDLQGSDEGATLVAISVESSGVLTPTATRPVTTSSRNSGRAPTACTCGSCAPGPRWR